jgi:hypothetical protein
MSTPAAIDGLGDLEISAKLSEIVSSSDVNIEAEIGKKSIDVGTQQMMLQFNGTIGRSINLYQG